MAAQRVRHVRFSASSHIFTQLMSHHHSHASRYLELYNPNGSIEIAQTSRYSKWTGKNELCILATRAMQPGFLIAELKGSMADLTEEEDRELKRTGPRNDGGTRRDFSVIHSKQLKKNHLFLGPARFVNVSGRCTQSAKMRELILNVSFHSTIAKTTVSYFAAAVISLSELSSLLLRVRRLPLITAMVIVRRSWSLL